MSQLHEGSKYVINSFGPDVFEDPMSARIRFKDHLNAYLFKTLWSDYLEWHETNHKFYPRYESDKRTQSLHFYSKFVFAAAGF